MTLISLTLAKSLKESGLEWQPALHDFFTVPGSDLESRIFVVSDMMIDVQQLFGHQIITFNGAVEWSLDYIMIAEAVWIPRESQLREILFSHSQDETNPLIALDASPDLHVCQIRYRGKTKRFEAKSSSNAYGKALQYVLNQHGGSHNKT